MCREDGEEKPRRAKANWPKLRSMYSEGQLDSFRDGTAVYGTLAKVFFPSSFRVGSGDEIRPVWTRLERYCCLPVAVGLTQGLKHPPQVRD